jgi:hypothetical protein
VIQVNATAKTIATYAAAGMTDPEIAAKIGLTRSNVFEIRRCNNIPSAVREQAERKREEIARLHGCGLTDEEIALTTGLDWSCVRSNRRTLGLKPNRPLVPRGLPPRIIRAHRQEAARKYHAKKMAEQGKTPRPKRDRTPKPKTVKAKSKPVAAVAAPKPPLHDQIRPIRAALGGVFDREPATDVQGAVAVAMQRFHTDPAFARAWMEAGRA